MIFKKTAFHFKLLSTGTIYDTQEVTMYGCGDCVGERSTTMQAMTWRGDGVHDA